MQKHGHFSLRDFSWYLLIWLRRVGGVIERLYGYTYFKHPIQFYPGGWLKHMGKMDAMVGMKNRLWIPEEKKPLRLVCHFTRQ